MQPGVPCAYISDVLRVRKVGQVPIVELLCSQVVAVLSRPQLAGLDAIDLEELLVGHAECLAYGLGYGLGLEEERVKN